MAFAASSQQFVRAIEQRTPSVCRVHSCMRCSVAIESTEPCTFVPSRVTICRLCFSQEQALRHLPQARTTSWGAGLAATRRI